MKRSVMLNQSTVHVDIAATSSGKIAFDWQGKPYQFEVIQRVGDMVVLKDQDGQMHRLQICSLGQQTLVSGRGLDAEVSEAGGGVKKEAATAGGLNAPMPGKVFKTMAKVGDAVTKGQTLLVLEAMKMEHAIKADKDGKVKKILKEGELVQAGMALAELE